MSKLFKWFQRPKDEHKDLSRRTTLYQRMAYKRRKRDGILKEAVESTSEIVYGKHREYDHEKEEWPSDVKPYSDVAKDVSDFGGEIFTTLYDRGREIAKPEAWADLAHEAITKSEEWEIFKSFCRNDADMSAIGTAEFLEQIKKHLAELYTQVQRNQEEMPEEPKGTPRGGQGGGGGQGKPQSGNGDGQGEPQGEGEGDGEGEPQESLPQKVQEAFDKLKGKSKQAITKALPEMIEAKQTMDEFQGKGWGSASADPGLMEDNDYRYKLINQMRDNEMFKKIVSLAGRLKRVGEALPAKVDGAPDLVTGTELGNEITRLLPAEFGLLDDPDLEVLFDIKFAEKALNLYKKEGKRPLGRGPIIVLADISGSMCGQPNEWGRAISTALLMYGREQGRQVTVLNFNGRVALAYRLKKDGSVEIPDYTNTRYYYSYNSTFDPAKITADNILKVNSLVEACGGTSFDEVFKCALSDKDGMSDNRADIIMITDDCCRISEEMEKKITAFREDKGGRIFTYLINGGRGYTMTKHSDVLVNIDSLTDDNDIIKALSEPMRKLV